MMHSRSVGHRRKNIKKRCPKLMSSSAVGSTTCSANSSKECLRAIRTKTPNLRSTSKSKRASPSQAAPCGLASKRKVRNLTISRISNGPWRVWTLRQKATPTPTTSSVWMKRNKTDGSSRTKLRSRRPLMTLRMSSIRSMMSTR